MVIRKVLGLVVFDLSSVFDVFVTSLFCADFPCDETNKEPQTRSLRDFEQVSVLVLA